MKIKAVFFLVVVVLLTTGLSVDKGQARMGDIRAPTQSTTCNSCADCTSKLASGSYSLVTLTTNIWNIETGCITLNHSESNLTFDCDGHTIDGDDLWLDQEGGISMNGSHNTIQNCTLSDFDRGIRLYAGANNVIANNHLTSNDTGIELSGESSSNSIHDNTIDDNRAGIYLSNTSDNTINANVVCDNSYLDFSLGSGSGNSGDNNTCNLPGSWNDQGTTGCTNMCSGTATCNSCSDCSDKLNGSYDTVLLAANVSNRAGTCIVFGADNVVFDCDGHTLDGDDSGTDSGISLAGKSGNTVKNCTVTDFYYGIRLTSSSDDNTLEYNTTSSNEHGIYLYDASGNTIHHNLVNSNSGEGIQLYFSSMNTLSTNEARSNGDAGIRLSSSDSNTVSANDLLDNDPGAWGLMVGGSDNNIISGNDVTGNESGISLSNANGNDLLWNTVCSDQGPDFSMTNSSSANQGDQNTCDQVDGWADDGKNSGCTYRCSLCTDGIQNGDEAGVDCGGSYCPPCAQCANEPGTKWAPHDTPCDDDWPTNDGPRIGMNTRDDSCSLIEVCNPDLDYIVEDALLCCEYEHYDAKLSSGSRFSDKIAACDAAQTEAYNGDFQNQFNQTSVKQCLAHYIIEAFDTNAVYMQGYFHGEWCCYHSSDLCPAACPFWEVEPPARCMGTEYSCAGPDGETPDFQMDGHRCEYRTFFRRKIKKHGYWESDTNYLSNSDSVVDLPAHASINRLSTGTCVDYSFALTTMLRKAGYSQDEVLSVNGEGHGYNLVRFPSEAKWHYVDTVGNTGGGVYGGIYPSPLGAWYDYCRNMDDGCSNDVYRERKRHCPSNDSIFGCEGIDRALSDGGFSSLPEPESPPGYPYTLAPAGADQQDCTELNPCDEANASLAQVPGPAYEIEVSKELSHDEISLGQSLEVSLYVANKEAESLDVVVQETFAPGITYGLQAQEKSYEGFTFQYHDWSLQVAAGTTETLTFTATPDAVGYYVFRPTLVFTGGKSHRSSSPGLKVVCSPNGSCDPGETYVFCPQDCQTGIQDDYCDMVADGRIDPDCPYKLDPDHDGQADTDEDGILDAADECPLTPARAVVDGAGCTCAQKICPEGGETTINQCNPDTAACEYLADADQDDVPDDEDNCPNTYNPEQYDCNGNGTGDQCEIRLIDTDTTLEAATYCIDDSDLKGAVTITASNLLLDCNGATILGTGVGYGIYVPDHVDHVTVKGCTVRNYRYGIYLDTTSDNQLISNTLDTNAYGLLLGFSSNNAISHNLAVSNTFAGLYLEGSTGNDITDNSLNANHDVGLLLHTSPDNDLSQNTICNNANADLDVHESASSGSGNACDEPGDWNDQGATGCSRGCGGSSYIIYLPVVLRGL